MPEWIRLWTCANITHVIRIKPMPHSLQNWYHCLNLYTLRTPVMLSIHVLRTFGAAITNKLCARSGYSNSTDSCIEISYTGDSYGMAMQTGEQLHLWFTSVFNRKSGNALADSNLAIECTISKSITKRHDDVIKWKPFPRYWPFVRGIHRWIPISQRPVTRGFGVLFDQRLNKQLSKLSKRRWFETPLRSLWRRSNGLFVWLQW